MLNVGGALDNGSLSVEYDLGMEGTEGVSEGGVLLNIELSGLLDLARTVLRRDRLPLAWPFEEGSGTLFFTSAADNGDVFRSVAGLEPLTWRVGSGAEPVSLRSRVFVGDGDGDRDVLIQDFRARVEIDPATEDAFRSVPCIVPSLALLSSSGRSCEDGSGPMVNLDVVNGVSEFFCCLLEPSRLNDLLGDFKASSGPFLVEA